MPLDERAAYALLDQVLATARRVAPGADVVALMSSARTAHTRFAANEITTTGDVDETSVHITMMPGRRRGDCTLNQLDPASLQAAIERTARFAKLLPDDPEWMPPLGPQRYRAVPAVYDAATEHLGAEARAQAARTAIARARDARVQIAGFFEHEAVATAMASSAGMRCYHRATGASLTMTARTAAAAGTGSGWAGATADRVADLDADALARVAIDKAVRSTRPRRLDPGQYTVILEPVAVAELLCFLADALDARAADEGRSCFSRPGGGTRVGERLFGDAVTLRSDPADPLLPGTPFDEDGLSLEAHDLIRRGTLGELLRSRYWAAKQGQKPTGYPRTFHLLGGATRQADLVAGVERGVLITRFWYTRLVDPQSLLVTGLTRDGVFLVEKGAIVAPVNNFRWNESPLTMLRNADAIAQETVRSPYGDYRVRAPALRTHDFHLTSVSEAV